MLGPGPGYEAWSEVLADGGPPHGRLSTGDRLTLDSIRFRVLWPDPNRVPERPPDGGTCDQQRLDRAARARSGRQRFLLAGRRRGGRRPGAARARPPAGRPAQGRPPRLEDRHDRSRSSRPRGRRVAVVSAGAGNPYGHPAPATIERLAELAGRTYRTDTDGTVEVAFDGAVAPGLDERAAPDAEAAADAAADAAGHARRRTASASRLCRAPRSCAAIPPAAPAMPGGPASRLPSRRPRPRRRRASGRARRSRRRSLRGSRLRALERLPDPDPRIGRANAPSATIAPMETLRASATAPPRGTAPLAYFWGDDAYGLEAAVEAFRDDPNRFPDGPPERWRPETERRRARPPPRRDPRAARRRARCSAAGSLAIVPRRWARWSGAPTAREALAGVLATVAPGNGAGDPRGDRVGRARTRRARRSPRRSGAPAATSASSRRRARARSRRGSRLAPGSARSRSAPGAARELATRVGGFVREGDVERQQQGRIAVMELEKLALRHADRRAGHRRRRAATLVAEAVPGSMWAFVDAVGMRQRSRALELLERLIEDKPAPVLLAVLHRRIRELIEVQDRLERGESPGLPRPLDAPRAVPRRDARASGAGLDGPGARCARSTGLVELDAQVKGVGGRAVDGRARPPGVRSLDHRSGRAGLSRRASRERAGERPPAGRSHRPGALLEDEVALDRERAPAGRRGRAARSGPGSMYSWWQSAHSPPGMPKHSRSLWSGSRKVASNRVLIRSLVQAGQRSRAGGHARMRAARPRSSHMTRRYSGPPYGRRLAAAPTRGALLHAQDRLRLATSASRAGSSRARAA